MRSHSESGFSYLEILLALANFAIGFAALLSLNTVVSERNVTSEEIAIATVLAQNELEVLKLTGYDALVDAGVPDGMLGPMNGQGVAVATGKFTLTWDITADTPMAGVKKVQVAVQWVDPQSKTRVVTLNTLVTDAL